MQNKQGDYHGGNVASEEAAICILEFCVLPQILKDLQTLPAQVFKDRQMEVATALHVEPVQVCWPAWVSKDNASTFCHGWLRLMNPRVATEATKANLLPALRTLRVQCNPHAAGSEGDVEWRGQLVDVQNRQPAQEFDRLRQWYVRYISDNQGTHVADPVLLAALVRDLQLLHFHQAMPLGPKMPECHSMIEHAIGTAKGYVKKQLDMISHDDPQLLGALWYQTKLQEAIDTKLSGAAGRNHVRGSVQKWKFCVQIVAADTTTSIHVRYPKNQFSCRGRGRPLSRNPDPAYQAMVDEWVSGTAGGYPPAWLC